MEDEYYENQQRIHSGQLDTTSLNLIINTVNSIMSRADLSKPTPNKQDLLYDMQSIYRECRSAYIHVKAYNYLLMSQLLIDFIKQNFHRTKNQETNFISICALRLHHFITKSKGRHQSSSKRYPKRSPIPNQNSKKKRTFQMEEEEEHEHEQKKMMMVLQKLEEYKAIIASNEEEIQKLKLNLQMSDLQIQRLKRESLKYERTVICLQSDISSMANEIRENRKETEQQTNSTLKKKEQKIKELQLKFQRLQKEKHEKEEQNKDNNRSLIKKNVQLSQKLRRVKDEYDIVLDQLSKLKQQNHIQKEELKKIKETVRNCASTLRECAERPL